MLSLNHQVRLRFTGSDRLRYLNGQVTNDVRKLRPGVVQWSGVTNHKGRLEALVAIHLDDDDDIYLEGPAALREFLPARLEKYIIADDVICEDFSDDTVQAHFLEVPPPLPASFRVLSCHRLGVAGWDVWGPVALAGSLPPPSLSHEAAELLRIDHGIPAWESELQGDLLLPETGLESWAVDYHKGCYIGQEVVSRLKSVGHVNRHLARLISHSGPAPEAGWLLYAQSPEGVSSKSCGEITSTVWHEGLQKTLALGYVRREQLASLTPLLTGPGVESLFSQITVRNT